MTSWYGASGLHLELNNFRKLIEELPKQEEGKKLQDCILHLQMHINICLNASLELAASGVLRCGHTAGGVGGRKKKEGKRKRRKNHLRREISNQGNYKAGLCTKKPSIKNQLKLSIQVNKGLISADQFRFMATIKKGLCHGCTP